MPSGRTEASYRVYMDVLATYELQLLVKEALALRDVRRLAQGIDGELQLRAGPLFGGGQLDLKWLRAGDHDDEGLSDIADDLVMQMAFVRMVDSFQTYLAEIIHLIALRRPEVLKGGDQVKTEDILAAGAWDDLVAMLAERRVDHLSRAGYSHLIDFISTRLGASAFDDQAQAERVTLLVEVRNLFAHHRGRIHKRFAQLCGLEQERVDTVYDLEQEFIRGAATDILAVTTNVDRIAVEKFGVVPVSIERG